MQVLEKAKSPDELSRRRRVLKVLHDQSQDALTALVSCDETDRDLFRSAFVAAVEVLARAAARYPEAADVSGA